MSNPDGWADAHKIALELAEARPGMVKLGAMLAAVVEDKLRPALNDRRVQSCLHVLDDVYARLPHGGQTASNRQVYICPMHPYRLLCDAPPSGHTWQGCVTSHYATEHKDEHLTGKCFVCEARLRDDFTPIVAEVQLHRPVVIYDDNRARDHWFQYTGTLVTLPVTYLCPRHMGLVELPLRMAWPMSADDASPDQARAR
jgi:hypothetical protein